MAITPPNFQKDAVPTLKGWTHPKTGELLKSQRITQAEINEYLGVTPEPKVVEEVAVDVDVLEEMTKDELETYAREEFDVELDKRRSKKKLIDRIKTLTKR